MATFNPFKDADKRLKDAASVASNFGRDAVSTVLETTENFLTQGVFDTDSNIENKKKNEKIIKNAARNKAFFNEIMKDQTISEVTRGELLKRFDTLGALDDGAFGSISDTFSQAKEGTAPKFKARQATEEFLEITRDRPGQKQTRFVDSVSNLGV